MRCRWIVVASFVSFLVACQQNGDPPITFPDGDPDAYVEPPNCNVLLQSGCSAGEKCTWILDELQPAAVGHIGCVPDGTVAVGGACFRGAPGVTGYDDCARGAVCEHGTCKEICDFYNFDGIGPTCDGDHACLVIRGFLGPEGLEQGGVCEPSCDPLADNDFDGDGPLTKTGSACGSDQGCYGSFDGKAPTVFGCGPAANPALVHRSACTAANGCAYPDSAPYLAGCAPGYEPLILDDTGSSSYVCRAFCKPADCHAGNCGSAGEAAIGAAPHRCSSADALGTFTNPDASCVYGWWFERGSDGSVLASPYSDTVGLCLEHADRHLPDESGMSPSTTPWPACDALPLTAAGSNCYGASGSGSADLSGCTAADFGCVSTTTGGIPTHAAAPARRHGPGHDRPRLPYHRPTAP